VELRVLCCEHLEEEETLVPPLLRDHFTPEEEKALVEKIMKTFDPKDLALILPWTMDAMNEWAGEEFSKGFIKKGLPP